MQYDTVFLHMGLRENPVEFTNWSILVEYGPVRMLYWFRLVQHWLGLYWGLTGLTGICTGVV